jgi:hypothetical protein
VGWVRVDVRNDEYLNFYPVESKANNFQNGISQALFRVFSFFTYSRLLALGLADDGG